jgi:AcrR family transcriptional regulator
MMARADKIDKKELIIERAVSLFATNGYYKTTTAQVAKAAGVTQPYVFHFFKNKEELFQAVLERATDRLFEVFEGVQAPAEHLHLAMGEAFIRLMHTNRDEILMVMQSPSINEPAIRQYVRDRFDYIQMSLTSKFERVGHPNAKAATENFLASGLLITLSEVLTLPSLCAGMLENK